ncbi:MAG: MBL fold metallo-hydrolase [Archaeoglobaceae archaeon]
MRLRSRGCNVYLLEDERILIDAGTSASIVLKQVSELEGIVITHAHFDHFAAAAALQERLGCPVYVHEEDLPYLLGEKKFSYRGVLGAFAKIGEILLRPKPPKEVRSISELGIEVIHTPGHTPGHVCVLHDGKLYCGDLLRGGAKLSRREFCYDYDLYIRSVKSVAALDFDVILPGHGGEVSRKEFEALLARLEL